jgi:protein TonB
VTYPPEALAAGSEGRVVLRCAITVDGDVERCRVLRSDVPSADAAVVEAVERRTYCPATLHGRPLEVNYSFALDLRLDGGGRAVP